MIDTEFIAITLQTIGHILVAYTAISVHHRVWKEHEIDEKVFRAMRKEQVVGILWVIFIIVGYAFHIT